MDLIFFSKQNTGWSNYQFSVEVLVSWEQLHSSQQLHCCSIARCKGVNILIKALIMILSGSTIRSYVNIV